MKIVYSLICTLFAAMLLFSACSGGGTVTPPPPSSGNAPSAGNSTITEGVMTTSVDDMSKPTGGILTSFPVSAPAIYCSFKVNDVVKEDMIKATWIYVGGAAADKANTQINETYDIVQVSDPSYNLAFYLDKPVAGWDKGDYKVVLSINGKEKLSVPFKVE